MIRRINPSLEDVIYLGNQNCLDKIKCLENRYCLGYVCVWKRWLLKIMFVFMSRVANFQNCEISKHNIPKMVWINDIGFGSHGHVRKSPNHEHEGFANSPRMK